MIYLTSFRPFIDILASWLFRNAGREQLPLSLGGIAFGIGFGKVRSSSEAIVFLRLHLRIIMPQHNSIDLFPTVPAGGATVCQTVSVLSFRKPQRAVSEPFCCLVMVVDDVPGLLSVKVQGCAAVLVFLLGLFSDRNILRFQWLPGKIFHEF